jgi:glycosyltransferase involved in cell wall biosynthesis
MRITVIVCTFNRCQSLEKALRSIAVQDLPSSDEWEVLVVDNNSTDRTREIVESFSHEYHGRFRYLLEREQGLSFARNAGVREASGEILAFTDDDVIVEPGWVQNLTSSLRSGGFAGSGGRILPQRTVSPPRWLDLSGPLSLLGTLCAYRDPGDAPANFEDPPYGANMAFRREMFRKYGCFRTDLGHSPGNKVGFEDTEFGHRLLAGGERLSYVPSAVVYHEVDESKMRKDYFLSWWFDFGRGYVRQFSEGLTAFQILKLIGRTILTTIQWLLAFGPQRRFFYKCRVWFNAGKIAELTYDPR